MKLFLTMIALCLITTTYASRYYETATKVRTYTSPQPSHQVRPVLKAPGKTSVILEKKVRPAGRYYRPAIDLGVDASSSLIKTQGLKTPVERRAAFEVDTRKAHPIWEPGVKVRKGSK